MVGSPVFTTEGDDWHLNASMGYVSDEWKWDWYADGYKEAADLIVQFVEQTHMNQDILVFPIVFNYRQYLELRLKELLMISSFYLDQEWVLNASHDLMVLWRDLLPKLKRVDDRTDWAGVEHVIREFNEIDIGSFAFRYPVLSDGATPSLPDVHGVNLGVIRDRIHEVSGLLDGMSMGLSEYLSQKREMEGELRREAASYGEPPDYGDGY